MSFFFLPFFYFICICICIYTCILVFGLWLWLWLRLGLGLGFRGWEAGRGIDTIGMDFRLGMKDGWMEKAWRLKVKDQEIRRLKMYTSIYLDVYILCLFMFI